MSCLDGGVENRETDGASLQLLDGVCEALEVTRREPAHRDLELHHGHCGKKSAEASRHHLLCRRHRRHKDLPRVGLLDVVRDIAVRDGVKLGRGRGEQL